ncbi:hypothetical protein MS2017_1692 [Bathymodiolus thermophilus thioautotrophic gill symbiont]|uniref:KAP NTPase domain-containing protein n=1 Tax=Bathymodiolus thermophilus thioautotrophic gill symbiont TaxID=2360 RepID=A0A3G3INJ8_9GAMM|nr:P-loop NTPase fold protein [Bathymodiolus thermophilus thioautotrophic gill symbiont]AYQ57371.1 hypothetical protein MS2017_1692 [Bathymodiolus thermophilus thioautotrophic gill symbiont]
MITTNKPIEISEDDIFVNDCLDRKEVVEDLSCLISSSTQPFVFSVNADWGSGKTTFVKLWKTHLEKEHGVKSVYFSAWEDDFTSDPLIAILGELDAYIKKNNGDLEGELKNVKKTVGKILGNTMPAIFKGVAKKVIGNDAVDQIVTDFIESSATVLIDNYQTEKTALEEFKRSITEILQKINKGSPFVIFIDELDRCRPLYAIECLERIKHIFGIKHLVFVLSIDKKNLAESIKSQYGNIDTDNYLRRFIDLEFDLKNPSVDEFCDVLERKFQLNNIIEEKISNTGGAKYYYLPTIKTLVIELNLSLRQVEQIFTKLQIVFKTTKYGVPYGHFLVLALFETFKTYDNDLYFGLINGKEEAENKIKELIEAINNDDLKYFKILIIIIIGSMKLDDTSLYKFIKTQLEPPSIEDNYNSIFFYGALEELFINIYSMSKRFRNPASNQIIKTAIKQIAFTDKFNLD